MTEPVRPCDDLVLWHCLAHVPPEIGFYIDIGADDPQFGSLTKSFHDRGWHGVNLASSPIWFARLRRDRPRGINILAAIANPTESPADPSADGTRVAPPTDAVPALPPAGSIENTAIMTELCERYAPTSIHFARVAVEGREGAVLCGMDFSRFRPWVLVVEAPEPAGSQAPIRPEWQTYLADADYAIARIDAATRYYVARDHPELLASFASPMAAHVRLRELRRMAELEALLLPPSAVDAAV